MKPARFLSYAALPVVALLLTIGYVRAREASAGVQVTPVAYPSTDVARLLDAHFWEFNVSHLPQSAPAEEESTKLVVREPGKQPHVIGGIGLISMTNSPLHDGSIVIGIAPVDGGDLQHARKIRCFIKTQGDSGSSIVDNPFLTPSSFGSGDEAVRQPDGSFLLAVASRTHAAEWPSLDNDVTLSLTVETRRVTVPLNK